MSFDLYAPALPQKPPAIPGFRWRAEDDGTWTAGFNFHVTRVWLVDRAKLEAAGLTLARYNVGTTDLYHRVRFTPGVVGATALKTFVADILDRHGAYFAERARIDAGHAARAERASTAVARARACIEKYPAGFSRNPRIAMLLKEYPTDSILLELDRLAVATEAMAIKKGIAR